MVWWLLIEDGVARVYLVLGFECWVLFAGASIDDARHVVGSVCWSRYRSMP